MNLEELVKLQKKSDELEIEVMNNLCVIAKCQQQIMLLQIEEKNAWANWSFVVQRYTNARAEYLKAREQ